MLYLEERNLISLCWEGERRNKEVKREIGFGFLCPPLFSLSLCLPPFQSWENRSKSGKLRCVSVRKRRKRKEGEGESATLTFEALCPPKLSRLFISRFRFFFLPSHPLISRRRREKPTKIRTASASAKIKASFCGGILIARGARPIVFSRNREKYIVCFQLRKSTAICGIFTYLTSAYVFLSIFLDDINSEFKARFWPSCCCCHPGRGKGGEICPGKKGGWKWNDPARTFVSLLFPYEKYSRRRGSKKGQD